MPSLSLDDASDDANVVDRSTTAAALEKVLDECSAANAADEVATSGSIQTDASTGLAPLSIDLAVADDTMETPTSPKDGAAQPRSSMFSKRAGVMPTTPPIKESRGKKSKSSPVREERPKSKGCCTLM